jgi:ABC-type Zn uptake system ZnuABC Zn-binding protein ZnuA
VPEMIMPSFKSVNFVKFFIAFFIINFVASVYAIDDKDELSVLTGTQVTYSLTSALLANTDINVINIPADGRRFDTLKDYIERRLDRLSPTFQSADAVVSMTNALPSDPLYRFAREKNIRLVNIDAAQPWSFSTSGVSIINQPQTNVSWATNESNLSSSTTSDNVDSPYFWLSPSNAMRMTDIIGADLTRLFPTHEKIITTNRNQLIQELRNLLQQYQNKLLTTENISIFALANEFVYLSNDLGLFVDGYFLKQDINWTEADLSNFEQHLISNNITVVLHKWEPSEAIQAAIENAGAQLVILDTADPGMSENRKLITDGYQQILQKNLEAIYQALAK